MMVRQLIRIWILAAACFWANTAWAGCYNPGACTCVVALTSIAFGNYDPQSSGPTDTVGTLSVSCVSGDPGNSTMSISLSGGSSGNPNARTMLQGVHPLYYNLYSNVARTTVWGNDSGGGESVTASFPLSRSAKTFSIYGRIPAMQNAWAGAYRDSITVTVAY